jgi:Protein of unknown function (DUF1648)
MNTLKSIRAPLLVLLVLVGLGAASFVWAAGELPAHVASHFDGQGKANGWMNRDSYLKSMAAIGLAVPLLMVGTGLMIGVLPSGIINLPHRDYWLSPERRGETSRYLARHMAWLACMVLGLFLAVHYLVVEGNRATPPHLSNIVWILLAVFLGFVTVWICVLAVHFSRPSSVAK